MASARQGQAQVRISQDSALAGILALLVDEREERARESKPDERCCSPTRAFLWRRSSL
jgi:hypothetical protein